MADYKSKFTGTEIDARLEYGKHENLLDNSWFTVNQRGYTSGNIGGYTVDRWQLNTSNRVTVSVEPDGAIKISKTAADQYGRLQQKIENAGWLAGKTVTISALVKNTGGFIMYLFQNGSTSGSGISTAIVHGDYTLLTATLTLAENLTALEVGMGFTGAHTVGETVVKAVKMELGTISTLSDDVLPNYEEELAKCQRYYQIYATAAERPADVYDCRPVMRDKSTSSAKNTTPTQGTISVSRGGTATTYYYNDCNL